MTPNKKFKYPLAISGSTKELEALIPELEKMGYVWSSYERNDHCSCYPYLITCYNSPSDYSGLGFYDNQHRHTIVPASNPTLVLSLAAMVDNSEFYEGEILKFGSYSDLYRYTTNGDYIWLDYISRFGARQRYDEIGGSKIKNENWHKATKEEIIEHFTPKVVDMETGPLSPNSGVLFFNSTPTKKIIGWNVKKGVSEAAAFKAVGGNGTNFLRNAHIHGVFSVTSLYEDVAKQAGILELLFEPVYEEEKKFVSLECGLTVEIFNNRLVPAAHVQGREFTKRDLNALLERSTNTLLTGTNSTSFKPTHFATGCNLQYSVSSIEIENIISLL